MASQSPTLATDPPPVAAVDDEPVLLGPAVLLAWDACWADLRSIASALDRGWAGWELEDAEAADWLASVAAAWLAAADRRVVGVDAAGPDDDGFDMGAGEGEARDGGRGRARLMGARSGRGRAHQTTKSAHEPSCTRSRACYKIRQTHV